MRQFFFVRHPFFRQVGISAAENSAARPTATDNIYRYLQLLDSTGNFRSGYPTKKSMAIKKSPYFRISILTKLASIPVVTHHIQPASIRFIHRTHACPSYFNSALTIDTLQFLPLPIMASSEIEYLRITKRFVSIRVSSQPFIS